VEGCGEGDEEGDVIGVKKIHRFIGAYDLRATEIVLEDAAARQIGSVLKMRAGESVLLCDGKKQEAEYRITKVIKNKIALLRAGEIREIKTEPETVVTLYAAILKRESFEWAVQKAVECGVTRIVPLVTRRTIKKDVKQERLQEIAKEAAEQSGRGIVPAVSEPMSLAEAIKDARQNEKNYFFDVGTGEGSLKRATSVGLFIGPEGGWDEEEISLAKKTGLVPASLGPRVLRGETAVAIAAYLMTM
jgi:16S rRNA (uracil1498-N3)-methyltransferase